MFAFHSDPRSPCWLFGFGGLAVLLVLPSSASAQGAITGIVKDASGAVLPGVTVEAASPVLIEKGPFGRERRHRPVPNRQPAAGHLLGDVHVAGLQHRQTRRDRVDRVVCGHRQWRSESRRARGNDHGDRRNADRRRPERESSADGEQGHPRRHSQFAERRRHPGADPGHEYDDGFRRHLRWHRRDRRNHPRRPRQRFSDLQRRHQHGLGRRERRRREHGECRRRAGSRAQHVGRPGRSGNVRGRAQRHAA